jgi:type I restriction enzyme R subunit
VIAEWPTKSGPADYALFIGTRCVAVVEAKRRNRNVSSHIDQAQRYARGFLFEGGAEPIGGPWNDSNDKAFVVPFVFSANGRPYLRQIETESGIWFRDARKPTYHRRALADWLTPDGLNGICIAAGCCRRFGLRSDGPDSPAQPRCDYSPKFGFRVQTGLLTPLLPLPLEGGRDMNDAGIR